MYSFDKTWPVLLIVFGLLSLLKRGMEPAPPPPPPPPMFPPPQYNLSARAEQLCAEHLRAARARQGRFRRQRAAPGRCPRPDIHQLSPGDSV